MVADAGLAAPQVAVPPPPPVTVRALGVTELAVAPPVFDTTKVTVIVWPTLTGVGAADMVPDRAAAV